MRRRIRSHGALGEGKPIIEAGDRRGAAQLSYVALADVSERSGRRAAFLPGARAGSALVLATLLFAVSSAVGAVRAGPAVATSPTINGTATQGSVLTATPGSWRGSGAVRYRFRWYRCDTMGGRCGFLRGGTKPRHKLGANDVGQTLAVDVRATDSAGSTNGYSSLIGPIAAAKPALASTAQPSVSGTTALGGSVHVDPGKWSPAPKSFAYQWVRCNANGRACAPIPRDTGPSHTIVRRDVAHSLVAIVQAISPATSRAVLSRATPRIGPTSAPPPPPTTTTTTTPPPASHGPAVTAAPSVTAIVQQGKQLAGAAGTWSGSGTITYAYQWYRCDPAGAHCTSIHGSTKSTYTQVAKDVGNTLGLTVRATDSGGTTSAYASLVGPVASRGSPLYATAQPTITGNPVPGQTLQATTGSWSQPPTAFSYRWQRCNQNGRLCTLLPSTSASYAVTPADSGHTLIAIVLATAGGLTQSTWSVAVHVAAPPGPIASSRPSVTGAVVEGKQLTGGPGTWTSTGTISYAYQWLRCDAAGAHCSSIHGSTKSTYTQVAKDVGHTLGLAVRAKDENGTANGYASLVGPVAAKSFPLFSTAQPTISGTPNPGQTVQAGTGTWSQTPTAYSYRWQRCNENGRRCALISGATAASYAVTSADSGHTLVAIVQATAGSSTQPVVSVAVTVG
jgi:hypothetical protein